MTVSVHILICIVRFQSLSPLFVYGASIAYIGIVAPLMLYGLAYSIASKYTDLPVFYTEF